MSGEARKLAVLEQPATERTLVVDDHSLHLIEEQFGRNSTEESKSFFEAAHEHGHRLAGVELQP